MGDRRGIPDHLYGGRVMLIGIPDYYKEFSCTADACEDTCCAGWQIVIDRKSLGRYKKAVRSGKASEEFRKKLKSGIQWRQGVFRQDREKRCAFLNEENLCDLYSNLGRGSLCRTCRRYPRHVEEFENVREITLSLSCPEVAKILMNRMEPVKFLSVETEKEEEYEEFDPFLYSCLADAREVILKILQDRSKPLDIRQRLVYGIAHDMQKRADRGQIFSCDEVLEKYQTPGAEEFVKRQLALEERDPEGTFEQKKAVFRRMFRLELLKQEWDILLLETEQYLYLGHTAKEYHEITKEFHAWIREHGFPWEIQKEQILVYFLYTYFCGAVYDGQILSKAGMALFSGEVLEELLKTRWLKNDRTLTTEDVTDLVCRYSRETEHSDENLKRMEKSGRSIWKRYEM